jgi:hypothetical protein
VVKHLTGTERFWFSIDFANLDVTWPWTDDDLQSMDIRQANVRSCSWSPFWPTLPGRLRS